jgi:hypothetical protein
MARRLASSATLASTVGVRTVTIVIDERVSATTAAALAARVNVGKVQLDPLDLRAPDQWWPLPAGTKFAAALAWTPTLHDATFAILDRLGRHGSAR